MPSTDPLDYVKRYIRWPYDRLRERAFAPRKRPLPIPDTGIFDSPYACVKINYKWVSHLIGIVETLLDFDSWQGTEEEQYLAKQEIEKLLATLNAACPEEEIVTSFRFNALCGMEYSNDNGETWLPVPGWSEFALACFQGAPGDDGETGPQGPPGATGPEGPPGDDCDCSIVPTQPPIPAEPNPSEREQQACNIAFGLGDWMHNFFDDSLDVVVAGVQAAKIISGIVGDLIDAFPVLGAIVDSLVNFAENVVLAGAEETKAANGEYFKEMIQCELYCIMKCDEDDFTVEYLEQVKQELIAWGIALPPQTPLLVIIGQIFAAWLATVPAEEILRRANVYKDDAGNCELCDCDDCPEDWCYTWDFTLSNGGWVPEGAALGTGGPAMAIYQAGTGWGRGNPTAGYSGRTVGIRIPSPSPISGLTSCKVEWTNGADGTPQIRTYDAVDEPQHGTVSNAPTEEPFELTVDLNPENEYDSFAIQYVRADLGTTINTIITRVTLTGTGTMPAFTGGEECPEEP